MTLNQLCVEDSTEVTKQLATYQYVTDPTKIDTVYLADQDGNPAVIKVPYCEYYGKYKHSPGDYGLQLLLSTPKISASYKDPSICIDEVMLIPVKDAE